MKYYNRFTVLSILFTLLITTGMALSYAQAPDASGVYANSVRFTFAVIGDNRPNRFNLAQPDRFKSMLKEIDAANPAFAVNVGDTVFGSSNNSRLRDQYKEYKDLVKSILSAKMYLALGNHEILGSRKNQDFFASEPDGLYYSFDHGNSHFVILDSEIVGQAGKITGDQLAWLRSDLQKSKAAHKFVFLHRPLYPVDGHMGKCMDQYPKDRDALHSLFVRNKVDTVFVGHEHLFNEQVKNGVRYIITGGGGASTYPSILGYGDFYHYILVNINGESVEMKLMKPAQSGKKAEVVKIGLKK